MSSPSSRRLALATAVAMLGIGHAQAAIVTATSAGGSELLLSVVNTTTSASITQDLGEQRSQIAVGDMYTLDSSITSFISAAGGLGGVTFAVIGGGAPNGTSAGIYLQSSINSGFTSTTIQNSTKGTWLSNLSSLITNLNGTNPGDSNTANNFGYGPFASGGSPNYAGGNHNRWGTAASNLNNLGDATADLFLFLVSFGSGFTGNAGIAQLAPGGAKAVLDLVQGKLVIQSTAAVVPVPGALWLAASGLGLLGALRRRGSKKD